METLWPSPLSNGQNGETLTQHLKRNHILLLFIHSHVVPKDGLSFPEIVSALELLESYLKPKTYASYHNTSTTQFHNCFSFITGILHLCGK